MAAGLFDRELPDPFSDLWVSPTSTSPGPQTVDDIDDRALHIALVAPPYFDIPPAGYGGIEAMVATLADELVERGHRVSLLGAGRAGTKARFLRVWDEVQAPRLGEIYPEVLNAMKVWRIIERLHQHDPIDILHDHTYVGPLNAPAYRSLGIPTMITVHGPVTPEMHEYYRHLDPHVKLVAISDRQQELASDLHWIARVHNAIRPEDWPFHAEKRDYALFLGRYCPTKGPDLALHAAHAAGVPLVLAGKCNEPPEKAYFEQRIRPLLTDTDHVFGEADATAKRELLASARCLLFPIQWEEPFGLVMIEAMVCGTPVVALRGGSVAEVIEHGVTGWICDDPAELPEAIARAGELDPHACRARVHELFAADRFAAGYEKAYHQAITENLDRAAASARTPLPAAVGARTRG